MTRRCSRRKGPSLRRAVSRRNVQQGSNSKSGIVGRVQSMPNIHVDSNDPDVDLGGGCTKCVLGAARQDSNRVCDELAQRCETPTRRHRAGSDADIDQAMGAMKLDTPKHVAMSASLHTFTRVATLDQNLHKLDFLDTSRSSSLPSLEDDLFDDSTTVTDCDSEDDEDDGSSNRRLELPTERMVGYTTSGDRQSFVSCETSHDDYAKANGEMNVAVAREKSNDGDAESVVEFVQDTLQSPPRRPYADSGGYRGSQEVSRRLLPFAPDMSLIDSSLPFPPAGQHPQRAESPSDRKSEAETRALPSKPLMEAVAPLSSTLRRRTHPLCDVEPIIQDRSHIRRRCSTAADESPLRNVAFPFCIAPPPPPSTPLEDRPDQPYTPIIFPPQASQSRYSSPRAIQAPSILAFAGSDDFETPTRCHGLRRWDGQRSRVVTVANFHEPLRPQRAVGTPLSTAADSGPAGSRSPTTTTGTLKGYTGSSADKTPMRVVGSLERAEPLPVGKDMTARYHEVACGMKSRGIRMVGLDLDMTMLSLHTQGHWDRPAKDLLPHVREFVRPLIISCCTTGIRVSVVTQSTQERLVHDLLHLIDETFGENVLVRCTDGCWERVGLPSQGKLPHIASAWRESIKGCTQSQVGESLDQHQRHPHFASSHVQGCGHRRRGSLVARSTVLQSTYDDLDRCWRHVLLIDDDRRNCEALSKCGGSTVQFSVDEARADPHWLLNELENMFTERGTIELSPGTMYTTPQRRPSVAAS